MQFSDPGAKLCSQNGIELTKRRLNYSLSLYQHQWIRYRHDSQMTLTIIIHREFVFMSHFEANKDSEMKYFI